MDDDHDPWDDDDFVGGAIPEAARRGATPQAVREWVEQVSQQLARDERRQRNEARETIRRQELRRRRPTTRSQTAATAAQPEEGDQCRICFSGAEDGKLISPCKCDGTQKYVHEDCLRKWQRTCAGTRKAKYCGVCRARFDLAPPAEPWSSRGLCGNQNCTAHSRHRRDASSMAWRCGSLTTRFSRHGRDVAEQ